MSLRLRYAKKRVILRSTGEETTAHRIRVWSPDGMRYIVSTPDRSEMLTALRAIILEYIRSTHPD